ncbi:MAG: FmdB family zinc ribbon protein [Rhodospirillaceae bacterium]
MPLYSYACSGCAAEFEILVGQGEQPSCPECGGQDLQRLLSRTVAASQANAVKGVARRMAAKEGHFSNYSRSERPKS